MVGGYTFSQMNDGKNWYCSLRKAGCKARVKMDNNDGSMDFSQNKHDHEPRKYHITSQGKYIFFK